ncbi:hypothetical protein [Streptomyces diastatochromogenes]|uniref:Uncharacterized protein n=1 Tax=Streptomyces diastatochromogenes TaxID=42236 RepID=A0A233S509_STRDA|nr:hypothetical protein [Streptomyces diastatochromogenes]OXY90653.1 hypothetical protein BEK98_32565 [Streptomyces diastatochromogenes]
MLALRLTRAARPAVQLRRLLVAAASGGTGFLLLGALGYALGHPQTPGAAVLRLAWCLVPLAATVYFALAVARTDPGTRPRPGLSAVGLGPARLMAISALTTALSATLGSMLALLVFLHLRGDLTGMPFDGAAAQFLAADQPLPLPAALTLLTLVPVIASTTVAFALRPRDPRPPAKATRAFGRFGAYGHSAQRETFGAYGRFGARWRTAAGRKGTTPEPPPEVTDPRVTDSGDAGSVGAGSRGIASRVTGSGVIDSRATGPGITGPGITGPRLTNPSTTNPRLTNPEAPEQDADQADTPTHLPPPREAPVGLPWGIATIAAGLAVQAYAGRTTPAPDLTDLPVEAFTVLVGWVLTALGLVLASPGLTHLCGRLLQAVRPGALRLLAGRVLMGEATRIGRPLGVVCAVASATYAMTALYDGPTPTFGPLTTLGALVVTGSTVATLLTAATEARQCRADTTAALLRLGAPGSMLRSAAALRAAALLAVFGPLTLVIANLAALPMAH